MRKYLRTYLSKMDYILNSKEDYDYQKLLENHLLQIQFMQHERLIHFLVTMLFTLVLFLCLGMLMLSEQPMLIALIVLIVCLLIPYIMHYYFLENSVQSMYDIYNVLLQRADCQKQQTQRV